MSSKTKNFSTTFACGLLTTILGGAAAAIFSLTAEHKTDYFLRQEKPAKTEQAFPVAVVEAEMNRVDPAKSPSRAAAATQVPSAPIQNVEKRRETDIFVEELRKLREKPEER